MVKKVVTVLFLGLIGLTLAGCSPCGFFWDDWRSGKVCRTGPDPAK